jgi:hypothetical protein
LCGGFISWQFGHSVNAGGVKKSFARRVLVRRFEWRRFGFGIKAPQANYCD